MKQRKNKASQRLSTHPNLPTSTPHTVEIPPLPANAHPHTARLVLSNGSEGVVFHLPTPSSTPSVPSSASSSASAMPQRAADVSFIYVSVEKLPYIERKHTLTHTYMYMLTHIHQHRNVEQERVAWSAPVRAARVVLPFLVALLENNTVRPIHHWSCIYAFLCPFAASSVAITSTSNTPPTKINPRNQYTHTKTRAGGHPRRLGPVPPPDA